MFFKQRADMESAPTTEPTMSNTPTLRFGEFDGEWSEKRLGDIATFYNSKRIPLTESDRKKGKYPYYGASGIIDYVDDYLFDGEYILLGEDGANIIMRNSRLVFLANSKFWVNNHAHIFQSNESNYFLCEALERINYTKYNTGTAQPKLNSQIVKKIEIYLPKKLEQQKIATFLSAVDSSIEQLSQKEQLLRDYKKGVMQKIFSRQIRFKRDDGGEFEDWVEKRLGDLFNYKNGGSFENQVVENGNYNLITLNSINILGNLKNEHKKINILDNSLNKNDLIMVLSDVAHGNFLGLTAIIPEDKMYVLNQRMGALKLKTENNISFLRIYINYHQRYFKLHGQGSSQQNLSKGDILKFIINLPSLPEQTKIANFLSALDKQIEQVSIQLAETKTFKRGLLQRMFV